MNRLEAIAKSEDLVSYAQGAAATGVMPIADFLAPTVPVSTIAGRYKSYSAKNQFIVPQTLRPVGGHATTLSFDVTDETYNCEPHALDFPIDNLEQIADGGLTNLMREAAGTVQEMAALAHERTVIAKALAAVGAGTSKTWNTAGDPIADLDAAIMAVIKSSTYGSRMGVGVIMGAGAWSIFKNQATVRGRFIVGSGGKRDGVGLAVATEGIAGQLLIGNPDIRVSYMVTDSAAAGLPQSMNFLLDNTVLIFARNQQPTRRDPSFMKTFRLDGQYMVPGSYMREDGRAEVAKFDWSEDVRVTNASAAIRLNVATA